jgi:hypothetical protein
MPYRPCFIASSSVRDSCRKDRQLYLLASQNCCHIRAKKAAIFPPFTQSKTVSSHFLFLPIFLPEGSGVLMIFNEFRTAGSPLLGQKQALGSVPMTRIDGANHLKQGFKSFKEDKKRKTQTLI